MQYLQIHRVQSWNCLEKIYKIYFLNKIFTKLLDQFLPMNLTSTWGNTVCLLLSFMWRSISELIFHNTSELFLKFQGSRHTSNKNVLKNINFLAICSYNFILAPCIILIEQKCIVNKKELNYLRVTLRLNLRSKVSRGYLLCFCLKNRTSTDPPSFIKIGYLAYPTCTITSSLVYFVCTISIASIK